VIQQNVLLLIFDLMSTAERAASFPPYTAEVAARYVGEGTGGRTFNSSPERGQRGPTARRVGRCSRQPQTRVYPATHSALPVRRVVQTDGLRSLSFCIKLVHPPPSFKVSLPRGCLVRLVIRAINFALRRSG